MDERVGFDTHGLTSEFDEEPSDISCILLFGNIRDKPCESERSGGEERVSWPDE